MQHVVVEVSRVDHQCAVALTDLQWRTVLGQEPLADVGDLTVEVHAVQQRQRVVELDGQQVADVEQAAGVDVDDADVTGVAAVVVLLPLTLGEDSSLRLPSEANSRALELRSKTDEQWPG